MKQRPCAYFNGIAGSCNKGERCAFSHDNPNGNREANARTGIFGQGQKQGRGQQGRHGWGGRGSGAFGDNPSAAAGHRAISWQTLLRELEGGKSEVAGDLLLALAGQKAQPALEELQALVKAASACLDNGLVGRSDLGMTLRCVRPVSFIPSADQIICI